MLLPDGCVTDKWIIPILFCNKRCGAHLFELLFFSQQPLFLAVFWRLLPLVALLFVILRCHIDWNRIISSIGSVFQLKSYKHWEQIFHVSVRLCSASHIQGWCQSLIFWPASMYSKLFSGNGHSLFSFCWVERISVSVASPTWPFSKF